MATKFVYSDTEVQEVLARYATGTTLEVLAQDYNKSVASVRMKLVKLGVYQKAVKPKAALPATAKKPTSTSKSAMLADYKAAEALVGAALF